MKIKKLFIPEFLIFNDFTIDFDCNNDFSVIIGDNGSGKSTLLEIIAYIFGHLHKYFVLNDKTAEFIDDYEIEFISKFNSEEYIINIKSVYVNQKTNTFKPIIKINNKEFSISEINKQFGNFSVFLPSRIGIYYAGEAKYLKELSEHFEAKFISALIKKDNEYSLDPLNLPIERPFYYIKYEYLQIILLSLLVNSSKNDKVTELLEKLIGKFDINNIEIQIILQKPTWANDNSEELWGIQSKFVNQFINKLNDTSYIVEVEEGNKILKFNYLGLLDIKKVFETSNDLDFPFIVLDTLLYNGILKNISIYIKNDKNEIVDSERFSEGQRQFIVTSGLSLLWMEKENKMFLFDEPDVFLHPKWQREFIPFLKPYFKNSFALITTHNPSLLSDIYKEQVHLFRKGKIVHKSLNTLGENFDRILIDYFGLDNTRSIEVSNLFEILYTQIRNKKHKTEAFADEYKKLEKIVGKDDKDFLMLNFELRKINEKN